MKNIIKSILVLILAGNLIFLSAGNVFADEAEKQEIVGLGYTEEQKAAILATGFKGATGLTIEEYEAGSIATGARFENGNIVRAKDFNLRNYYIKSNRIY